MKGKIIIQTITIFDSWFDWGLSGGEKIKRIIFPEVNNLAITPRYNQLYVSTGFREDNQGFKVFKVLKEIDVPDELVEKALALAKTEGELSAKFKVLMEQ